MHKAVKLFIALLMLSVFSSSVPASEFAIVRGWLMDEDCLKEEKKPCPLEEYNEEKGLVLVTVDEKIYNLEEYGVEDWKLQKAYSQLIGVKGLKEGETIKVTNIVQITGDKKLSKA